MELENDRGTEWDIITFNFNPEVGGRLKFGNEFIDNVNNKLLGIHFGCLFFYFFIVSHLV